MARDNDGLPADESTTTCPHLTLDGVTMAVPDVDSGSDANTSVLTIVGDGNPLSFEVAAHGTIDILNANASEEAIIIAGGVAEGAISTGFVQFAVSGDLGDVTFLDGTGEVYLGEDEIDAISVQN